jgi:hypothetical protein
MKNGIINARQDNKKIAAGLLAILLGPLEFINFFRLYIRRDNMVINQCFYMWNTNKFIRTYRRHNISNKIR